MLNIALLVIAYDADTKAKALQIKYFDIEKTANDQQTQATQLALDKFNLEQKLKDIQNRTDSTNKMLEDTRKQMQAMTKELADQTAQIEAKNKELADQAKNSSANCPPAVITPQLKAKPKRKKIPFDIAPSQQ